ncbi:hypothetical protein [Pseudodesulfovibrio tunisiensis]|uniref:hypothetical protein n=1 Tax=Pseudodesulfovibrio tunisiensis TaxID=463192 RepID=UPI001FB1C100|nr:hypothetical protein [Pseudodesulfovibrio tunisiensis]
MSNEHVTELFDEHGNLIGALLNAEAWITVKKHVTKELGCAAPEPEKPEPVADWELLKQYWDFPYPVDMDVTCECCGNQTEDWSADEPRKFRLSSANLAGLVSFTCQTCKAKIVKKHFKDYIKAECSPYQAEKTAGKEGRY